MKAKFIFVNNTAATFKIKDGWSTNTYDNKETIFQRDHLFDKGTHTIVMEPKRVEVLGIRLPDKGVGFEGTLAGPDGYNIEVSIECPADTVQYKASSNYLPSDASTFKLVKDVELSGEGGYWEYTLTLDNPRPSEDPNEMIDMIRDLKHDVSELSRQLASESQTTRTLLLELENVTAPYLYEIVVVENADKLSKAEATVKGEASTLLLDDDTEATAEKFEKRFERLQTRIKQIERGRHSFETATSWIEDPAKAAKDLVKKNVTDTFELRLLCGVTLEPVVTYKIDSIDEDVKILASQGSKMMARGLTVAKCWDWAADVVKFFGIPVPKVSKGAKDCIQEAKDFLDELQEGDADLEAAQATEEAGMDLEQMKAFAVYLEKLDKKKGRDEKWTDKLFPTADPGSGRLTFASAKEHGKYGGKAAAEVAVAANKAARRPPTSGLPPTPPPPRRSDETAPLLPNRNVEPNAVDKPCCCVIL